MPPVEFDCDLFVACQFSEGTQGGLDLTGNSDFFGDLFKVSDAATAGYQKAEITSIPEGYTFNETAPIELKDGIIGTLRRDINNGIEDEIVSLPVRLFNTTDNGGGEATTVLNITVNLQLDERPVVLNKTTNAPFPDNALDLVVESNVTQPLNTSVEEFPFKVVDPDVTNSQGEADADATVFRVIIPNDAAQRGLSLVVVEADGNETEVNSSLAYTIDVFDKLVVKGVNVDLPESGLDIVWDFTSEATIEFDESDSASQLAQAFDNPDNKSDFNSDDIYRFTTRLVRPPDNSGHRSLASFASAGLIALTALSALM